MKRLLLIFSVINSLSLIGNDHSLDAEKNVIKKCIKTDAKDSSEGVTFEHVNATSTFEKNAFNDFEQKRAQLKINGNQSLKRNFYKVIAAGGAISFSYWSIAIADALLKCNLTPQSKLMLFLRLAMDVGTILAAWTALHDIPQPKD